MGACSVDKNRIISQSDGDTKNRVGLKEVICQVEIKDYCLIAASLCVMFNFGSSWTGLTGSQLTLLRLGFALVSCLLLGGGMPWSEFPAYQRIGLVYCAYVLVEGFFGKISPGSAWVEGIGGALLLLVPIKLSRKYGKELALTTICIVACVLIGMVDLFAVGTGGKGFITWHSEFQYSSNYLIGDKFLVSYMNMICFAFLYWKFPSVVTAVIFGSLSIGVSALVECSTGVTGTIIMMAVIFSSYPVRFIPVHRMFIPIMTVILAVIAVAFTGLLTWGPFGSFITNVLGESSDLTGRTLIYPVLIALFLKKPLFGYLTANGANQAVMGACGAADAQEGLFHILLSNGLIGAILFLILEYFSLRYAHAMARREHGLYAFIVAMSICSVVEINLGLPFLLGLSMLALSLEDDYAAVRLTK